MGIPYVYLKMGTYQNVTPGRSIRTGKKFVFLRLKKITSHSCYIHCFLRFCENISAVFLGTLEEMKNLTKNKVVDSCTQTQFLPPLNQIGKPRSHPGEGNGKCINCTNGLLLLQSEFLNYTT